MHLTQWNMRNEHTKHTYTSLACTLRMSLHVPIPPLPPPLVHLPPLFLEVSVDYTHLWNPIC